MVMNTQLVKMVIMMNMLNSVGVCQGKYCGKWKEEPTEGLPAQSTPFSLALTSLPLPLMKDMNG